jgi:hypothetical protein
VTPLAFALATVACTVSSAILGARIRTRIPTDHLGKDSQDVIRLGMGLVATMTALLLGLVTAAAKGSFDSQDAAIRNVAANTLALDRLLARYGPEAQPAREQLKLALAARLQATWPESGSAAAHVIESSRPEGPPPLERIEDLVLQLKPDTPSQKWFQAEALKLTEEILRTRWRLFGNIHGSVPRTFLFVVMFWLAMTFGSFGLSAPRNATVMTIFTIAALSVGAAVYLILELDGPFDGTIRISSEAFRHALSNLGG